MSRIQEAGTAIFEANPRPAFTPFSTCEAKVLTPIDTKPMIPPKRDEEALIKRPKFGKGEFS
jgi:hypothetical protein